MRHTPLLFSFVLAASVLTLGPAVRGQTPRDGASAQTAPRTAPAPAQPAPAQPARPRTPARAQPARSGIALTVTNPEGGVLRGIHVDVTGPMNRAGDTNESGQVNFPGLPAGTYRVRFSGETVVTFEREATLRGGQVTTLRVALNPAGPPPAPPAPPPPAAPTVGPTGSPQWGSLTDLAKRARDAKPPIREAVLACSGNSRSVLLVLTEDQPPRVYDDAESVFYVMDGQGTITIDGKPGDVSPGYFVAVPRGLQFSITRRGNKPLSLMWVLSGTQCEEAR